MTPRKQRLWRHVCGICSAHKDETSADMPEGWATMTVPLIIKLKRPRAGRTHSQHIRRVSACTHCMNWLEDVIEKRREEAALLLKKA